MTLKDHGILSVTDEKWNVELLDTFIDRYPNMGLDQIAISWQRVICPQLTREYFRKLCEFVSDERKKGSPIFPPVDRVFNWTSFCPPEKVNVVIVSQNPYPQPGYADGLAFSVPVDCQIPASLANIYEAMKRDLPDFTKPAYGYLKRWAIQGVLLLNSVLTVCKGSPNPHADKGWEEVTDAVIRYISEKNVGVAFLLWGRIAKGKKCQIREQNTEVLTTNGGSQPRHLVLETWHPVSRNNYLEEFLNCRHFSQVNDFLKKHGKKPIDWSL